MSMQHKALGLARRYQAAMGRHLARDPARGAASLPALRIGRQAVALSLQPLDLALIHLKKEAETNTLDIGGKIESTQRLVEQSVDKDASA